MLIATLPTMVSAQSKKMAEIIISHPLIGGVRYNTGGASPYTPRQILETIKPVADSCGKTLYVDLEGRQVRIAGWTPFSRGTVTLNRDFTIELPAKINFRKMGWFEVVNALPEERKIFFEPCRTKQEWYLGESQSVHILAKKFEVRGYLNDSDLEYMAEASDLGIPNFMLSFVEYSSDVREFLNAYKKINHVLPDKIVLKIESQRGVKLLEGLSLHKRYRLMAARDDLFLAFADKRSQVLNALKLIIKTDPEAILASRLMSGLLGYQEELTLGDITDIALMGKYGYKNFMLADEMTDVFESAMQNWQNIALPLLESVKWKKK